MTPALTHPDGAMAVAKALVGWRLVNGHEESR